jgi:hypothetical protein
MLDKQKYFEELMKVQPDFNNVESVISWIEEVANCKNEGLKETGILEMFAQNGFTANMNCDDEFQPDNRENVAGWLIGQALGGIQLTGHISLDVLEFMGEWQ